ncbi:hypothetical protein KC19_8G109800 [Ceratodon purpureus]|uniref:Uncharacterized protein n=1 Tax=Ceratodon purpureus TaxID=3225 RepID=A0A8T0H5P8_CERPU|nr:hypothetical protein KC19_8G109800 [Ceratodon purpureus]
MPPHKNSLPLNARHVSGAHANDSKNSSCSRRCRTTHHKQTSKEASPRPRPANPPKKHPYSSHLTQQQKTLINSRITSSISPHPPTNTTTPTPHKKTHQEHPIQLTQNPPHLQSNSQIHQKTQAQEL